MDEIDPTNGVGKIKYNKMLENSPETTLIKSWNASQFAISAELNF